MRSATVPVWSILTANQAISQSKNSNGHIPLSTTAVFAGSMGDADCSLEMGCPPQSLQEKELAYASWY